MNIDHVVLWVDDAGKSLKFYSEVVGLEPVRQVEYEEGDAPFPSVRVDDKTIIDLMNSDAVAGVQKFTGGKDAGGAPVNHLCLSMNADEYSALRSRLVAGGIDITPGSKRSYGAQGIAASSEYFCDPDGNVIEIRHYG